MKKNCLICKKEIIRKSGISDENWLNRKKYCSRACLYKGLHNKNTGRRTGEYRNCIECKKQFYIIPSKVKRRKNSGQFCSKKCMYLSPIRNEKISGTKHYLWKGSEASYRAIHGWVRRKLGLASKCGYCGSDQNVQWSNKDHKYKRIIGDWQTLCAKCHTHYDLENRLRDLFVSYERTI